MRIVAMMLLAAIGVLAACNSGEIELVQVENPDVERAEGTTRPTAAPDNSNSEATDTAVTDESEVSESVQTEDASTDEADVDDSTDDQDAQAVDPDEPVQDSELTNESQTDDAGDQNQGGDAEVATEETPADSVEPIDVELGIVEVDPSDSWCDAAAKVDANFTTLNSIDHGDPQQLEAAFVQVYQAIEVTAELAPAEVANDAETERWVWEQMVALHAGADWGSSPLPQDRITELGEQNLASLQAVDEYTARTCA